MRILLCNERFLFRFGLDRALLLLGIELKALGHEIEIMGIRFDRDVVARLGKRVIALPENEAPYPELNEFAARWIESHWSSVFPEGQEPQVALIGGWPFFASIPVFERHGCRTVFMDCGAVPLDGFSGGAREIQEILRRMRRRYMPRLSAIAPISNFIAESQSRIDAPAVRIEPILLAANHLDYDLWNDAISPAPSDIPSDNLITKLREFVANGGRIVLNLGRWEPGCYKNSEAVFGLADRLTSRLPNVRILILADQSASIPVRHKRTIIPIGYPTDAQLFALMQEAALGVSVSLWEGFNLPVAEMQWLGRPALAYDVAAHPEVAITSWFLCRDESDMADKAIALLSGEGPAQTQLDVARQSFRANFTWRRTAASMDDLLCRIVWECEGSTSIELLLEVGNACRDPANSGVVRVTRRLARELQVRCRITYVLWDESKATFVFPTEDEYAMLGAFNGPDRDATLPASPTRARLAVPIDERASSQAIRWLLLPEIFLERSGANARACARRAGLRIAAVFYDAIPILRPDLVTDSRFRDNHADYMKGLGQCDLVVPISHTSGASLHAFWESQGIKGGRVLPNPLPGEFGGAHRSTGASRQTSRISVLCVSTLEPRKNHRRLIHAMRILASKSPKTEWTLTLVGNRYAGAPDIASFVENATIADARIRWLGIVDDERLHHEYQACTFTVYASEIEGFGLPILESLWHGKPCICHEAGVMAEIAQPGGCLMTDVTSEEGLASAIARLSEDQELYERLAAEAIDRPIKSWREYADQWIDAFITEAAFSSGDSSAPERQWFTLLYGEDRDSVDRMRDSEGLAQLAILQNIQPQCAISIGNVDARTLSLLSRHAQTVFAISRGAESGRRHAEVANVSFLDGLARDVLQPLLHELRCAQLSVNLVLLDGDLRHESLNEQIGALLSSRPRDPLFILVRNSFKPHTREAILHVGWSRSPYVHHVELDLVPGHFAEPDGMGVDRRHGGLALAFLSPRRRTSELRIAQSAASMFEALNEPRAI